MSKNLKTYKDDTPLNKRVFFHSITGEILSENSSDSECEIDNEDLRFFQTKEINQYLDICDKDKQFFNMWNNFMFKK
jgi:hypothetical protein